MEPKVLLRLSWHEGVPGGKNDVSLIREDFDIMDEKYTIEEIKKALLEYGATDIQFEYSFSHEYHFIAKIEKKNPHVREYMVKYRFPSEQRIKVEVVTIIEHRGRFFKMEEISE